MSAAEQQERQRQQRVILVTGANKGIGFEVVKKLAQSCSAGQENLIFLGSRDMKRGEEALAQLGAPANVHLLQLDTSSTASVVHAANEIEQKYGGRLDVIVNNAAITPRDKSGQAARETFAVNYDGVKVLNEHLLPLLRENGRVVNVASNMGAAVLSSASKDLQEKYMSPPLTTEQLDQLVEDYLSALDSNTVEGIGYTTELNLLSYGVSKAALLALTRIEARQWSDTKKVTVYAVCPGYCSTGISNYAQDSRPPELGADSVLHVVNTPREQLENGAFYRDGKLLPIINRDPVVVRQTIELINKITATL